MSKLFELAKSIANSYAVGLEQGECIAKRNREFDIFKPPLSFPWKFVEDIENKGNGWLQDSVGRTIAYGTKEEMWPTLNRINIYPWLLEFLINHHNVCQKCEGTGKIYNNADPESGQWVACPYAEILNNAREK